MVLWEVVDVNFWRHEPPKAKPTISCLFIKVKCSWMGLLVFLDGLVLSVINGVYVSGWSISW